MSNADARSRIHVLIKGIVLVSVAWLAGCAITGYVIAAAHGEHASILFACLGLLLGFAGAAAHGALLSVERFRKFTLTKQAFLLWIATLALAFLMAVAFGSENLGNLLLMESLAVVVIYFATPALVAAFGMSWLANRATA